MSMLKTLQEEKSEHKINFIYLTENSNYHIFKEALANIELPYLNKYIYYNNPQQDDFIGKDYEKTQFDIQELKRFAATNTNYYLCANSSLIDMLESSLIDLSISQENIFHEAFQPNKWV